MLFIVPGSTERTAFAVDVGQHVHTQGTTPGTIGRPLDFGRGISTLDGTGPRDEVVGARVFHTQIVKVGQVVIEHLGYHVAGVHTAHGIERGIVHGLVPTQEVVGGTVVVGVIDNSVVGIALHGLAKAVQNGSLIVLSFQIAAGLLLVQLVDPTGFQQIAEFEPLVNVTIVPEITHGERRKGNVNVLLEEFDGLVQLGEAAQIDGLARGVNRKGILGKAVLIRHLTVKVCHEHIAIGQQGLGHTGIVPVFGSHSLGIDILEGRAGAYEEPLVGSGHLTIHRIPVGDIPVVTAPVVTGPVTHGHAGTPRSELGGAVGVKLTVGKLELVLGRIQRGIFGVRVNIQPLAAGNGREGCNHKTANQYRFEKFHNHLCN